MSLTILGILVALLLPVIIGWRFAFVMLRNNPTPGVKMFFWVMSGLTIVLAGAVAIAASYLD
jgi:hypothetical protein